MEIFANSEYDINALANTVRAHCQHQYPWIKTSQAFVSLVQDPDVDRTFVMKLEFPRSTDRTRIVLEPHALVIVPDFGYAQPICHFDNLNAFVRGDIF